MRPGQVWVGFVSIGVVWGFTWRVRIQKVLLERTPTTTFMVLKSLFSFHPLSAFWFNPGYILCSAHIPSYFSMVNSWSKVIGSEEMAFALSPSLWFLEVAPMLIVFISIPSLSIFFKKKHFNIKRC